MFLTIKRREKEFSKYFIRNFTYMKSMSLQVNSDYMQVKM